MALEWEEELCQAITNDDTTKFQELMNQDLRDHDIKRSHWTAGKDPFHLAVSLGRKNMIEELLAKGVKINSYSEGYGGKFTCLHWAVLSDQAGAEIVQLLMDQGADRSLKAQWHNIEGTALEWALQLVDKEDKAEILRGNTSSGNAISTVASAAIEQGSTFAHQVSKFLTKAIAKSTSAPRNPKAKPRAESRTFTVNDIKDKDAKETELAKAMEIQREIHKSEKSLRHIQKERRKLKERERETVAKLHSLKSQPGHRTDEQIADLRLQVQELELLTASLKTVVQVSSGNRAVECPICMELPGQVYSCLQCDNWVCKSCKRRLITCPSCRVSFDEKPPQRNRAVERLIAI